MKNAIFKSLMLLLILLPGVAQQAHAQTAQSGWLASDVGRMAYVTDGSDLLLNWRPYARGLPAVNTEAFAYRLAVTSNSGQLILESQLSGDSAAVSKLLLILLEGDSQKASVNLFALAGFISSQLGKPGQRIVVGHLGEQLTILGEINAPEDLAERVASLAAIPDGATASASNGNLWAPFKAFLADQPEYRKTVITQMESLDAWQAMDKDFVLWSRTHNSVFYPLVKPENLQQGISLAVLTGARTLPWLGVLVEPVVAASSFWEQHAGGLLLYKLRGFYRLPFEGSQRLNATLTINDRTLNGQFVIVPEPATVAVLLDPRNWLEWLQSADRSRYGYVMFALLLFILLVTGLLIVRCRSQGRSKTTVFALLSVAQGNKDVPVSGFPFTIGRSRQCDLSLDETTVSRVHAQLELADDGGIVLRDLQSANGTYVNEHPVISMRLGPEESLRLGKANVHFRILELPE